MYLKVHVNNILNYHGANAYNLFERKFLQTDIESILFQRGEK